MILTFKFKVLWTCGLELKVKYRQFLWHTHVYPTMQTRKHTFRKHHIYKGELVFFVFVSLMVHKHSTGHTEWNIYLRVELRRTRVAWNTCWQEWGLAFLCRQLYKMWVSFPCCPRRRQGWQSRNCCGPHRQGDREMKLLQVHKSYKRAIVIVAILEQIHL